MNIEKIGTYFFVVGSIIAILSGALQSTPEMAYFKVLFLVLIGVFVGLLNVNEKDENNFILAGVGLIVGGLFLKDIIKQFLLLDDFSMIIMNFIIFISPAVVVVALKKIFHYASKKDEKIIITKKEFEMFSNEKYVRKLKWQSIWGLIILIAVVMSFIILLGDNFFNVDGYREVAMVIDIIISVIFIADLIVLYNEHKNLKRFLTENVFDIIAAIPFDGIFKVLKIVRIIKLTKGVTRTTRILKLSKVHKTAKFFSNKSAFNKFLKEHNVEIEDQKKLK